MSRTEASNRAQYKYNKKHLKRIPLDVQKDYYDLVKSVADYEGIPVNTLIKQFIAEGLERRANNECKA